MKGQHTMTRFRVLLGALAALVMLGGGMAVAAIPATASEIGGHCTRAISSADCVGVGSLGDMFYTKYTDTWHEASLGLTTRSESTTNVCKFGTGTLELFFAGQSDQNVYTSANSGSGWSTASSIGAFTYPTNITQISCFTDGTNLFVFASIGDSYLYQDLWQPGSGWSGWAAAFLL